MNLKAAFFSAFLIGISTSLIAQRLDIGHRIPPLEFSDVLNYRSETLRLSDIKGKMIILDFWTHYCSSCIKSFPKLDSLQKLFDKDIQIILVNSESRIATINFFEKRPKLKRPGLIMITNDQQLSKLFPAEGYPYCIWIDTKGVIQKFSGSHIITSNSISKFLKGEAQAFVDPTKKRVGSPINYNNFKYLSYLSQCADTLNIGNSEMVYTNDSNHIQITSNCSSIEELFKKAYNEKGKYNFNTSYGLNLKVDSSSKFNRPKEVEKLDHWLKSNGFNYELYLPASKAPQFYKIMQDDLKRFFQLEAAVKEKKIKTIVVKLVNSKLLKTEGGTPQNSFGSVGYGMEVTNRYRHLRNQPYSLLSTYLRLWIQYYYPVYDNIDLPFNIDIQIREESLNPFNIQNLNEDLKKAGLKLDFEYRPNPVLHLWSTD